LTSARIHSASFTKYYRRVFLDFRRGELRHQWGRALDLIDATYREVEKYPNQLIFCTTASDIKRAQKAE
jgi:hypothetical protein